MNALQNLFAGANTKKLLKAGFLEPDMAALTREGVRAMWSILIPKFEAELLAIADEAIAEKKEDCKPCN